MEFGEVFVLVCQVLLSLLAIGLGLLVIAGAFFLVSIPFVALSTWVESLEHRGIIKQIEAKEREEAERQKAGSDN